MTNKQTGEGIIPSSTLPHDAPDENDTVGNVVTVGNVDAADDDEYGEDDDDDKT